MKQTPPANDDAAWTLAELTTARLALTDEAAEIRKTLAAIAVKLAIQAADFVDGSGDELPNMGALLTDLDANTLLVMNNIDVLNQCEKALHRIAQLRYGICDACVNPIGKSRLKAIPRATLCAQCQHARSTELLQ